MKLAVGLLVMPGLLVVTSFIILLVVNLIFNPTFWMTPDGEPVTPTPFYINALNGLFVAIGGIGLISLLPSLVAGICIFANKKRSMIKNITS